MSVSVAYPTYPGATLSSSWTLQQYSMQGCTLDLQRYRAASEERKFIERIKALIF